MAAAKKIRYHFRKENREAGITYLRQGLKVRVQVECGVSGEGLPFLPRSHKGESLGLNCDPCPLHMLLYVPVDERRFPGRMIS